ncbi:hypothetical protein JKP88DRAFT_277987 [Tribonema minus]|uniref:Uncharacterized protein n=1 Tax=Tribonema minus TaxID=303371 RepID=A0A835YWA8_9STRA|nr:hypothetical protein JKP88DRAFT_277987 [Tribonema minus]
MHNLAELVTSYEGNDLHRELQARLNQLRFRGAELDDDGDVQEGADYLNILDICETVRYLTDGDNDASKGVKAEAVTGAEYREYAMVTPFMSLYVMVAASSQAAIAKMAEKLAPTRRQHRPPGRKHVRARGRRCPR